jgi:hypothetical protein
MSVSGENFEPELPKQKKKAVREKSGRLFEEAVHRFVKALNDPSAEIFFDYRVPDVRTGKLRQVDVWIVLKSLGHFPLKIAVSCKDYGRPLDVSHVEKFHAEIGAYGASGGVLYTRSGFRPIAIELANKFGIACCVLWQDRPADIPTLRVHHYYCCYDAITSPIVVVGDNGFPAKGWDEFFSLRAEVDGNTKPLADHLQDAFRMARFLALERQAQNPDAHVFPEDWPIELVLNDSLTRPTRVYSSLKWRKYRSKAYATLLNGSFCVTSGEFLGTESSPPLSVVYPPPPEAWEEVIGNLIPETGRKGIMLTKSSAEIVKALQMHLHDKAFIALNPALKSA